MEKTHSNKTINNIVHDYSSLIKEKYNIISNLTYLSSIGYQNSINILYASDSLHLADI